VFIATSSPKIFVVSSPQPLGHFLLDSSYSVFIQSHFYLPVTPPAHQVRTFLTPSKALSLKMATEMVAKTLESIPHGTFLYAKAIHDMI
jgi:hypothetical protein